MEAVEQNSDLLNEIAVAARTTPGDARDAWRVIGVCLADGRELPDWVKEYLRGASAKVALLEDAGSVEQLGNGVAWPRIATALGLYLNSEEIQTHPPKAHYDSLTVFSTIAAWRLEAHKKGGKLSLLKCFEQYINDVLEGDGEEETVKTAYYRGRAIAEAEIGLLDAVAARSA